VNEAFAQTTSMRVAIAPNALKGSLDARSAAEAIAEGFASGMPDAECVLVPVADGGDGTASVLVGALAGEMVTSDVVDPLGRKLRAEWGLVGAGTTAVIEMARASGLALLRADERNPMAATTYGAGLLVRDALARGCKRIVVGVGGSATVDGGAGFVEALGVRLLDAKGAPIARGGAGLASLDRIDASGVDARLAGVELVAACDVDNELVGEDGTARRFGPQKGATPAMVGELEANLSHLADVILRDLGRDVRRAPFAGAAGGLGAGLAGMLGARLESGIELVLEAVRFDERIAGCDWVVTAEGSVDRQTLGNKAPYGVARAAKRAGVPVVLLAGGVADDAHGSDFSIFEAMLPICPRPMSLADAMANARAHLTWTSHQLARLFAARATGKSSTSSSPPHRSTKS
jgi:glycerate kinase